MNGLFWTLILLIVGLTVMVLEVFVPSGGVLGFISVVAVISAVVMAFMQQGPLTGMLVLAAAVVAVPSVLMLAFRWFPRTPLGRRVLPPPPDASEVLPDSPLRRRARAVVGRSGRVVREMLPWGGVEIDGSAFEAVSESGPIGLGVTVEVVGVQGMAVIVRPSEKRAERIADASPARAAHDESGPNRLSGTLEDFEFEHFQRPSS